ncbi:hypothetical protein ACTXT7_003804 [Hymenolepis weldensis]
MTRRANRLENTLMSKPLTARPSQILSRMHTKGPDLCGTKFFVKPTEAVITIADDDRLKVNCETLDYGNTDVG